MHCRYASLTAALLLLYSCCESFQPSFAGQRRATIPSKGRLQLSESLGETVGGSTEQEATPTKKTKIALVVCPAQFCVPDDYEVLFQNLKEEQLSPHIEIVKCVVPPLPRTEWIKVAKKLPSKEFLDAKLPIHSTLNWYFAAVEDALADIFASEGPDVKLCFIGHSIGGWVARAYLGELSRRRTAVHALAQRQCTSLITLGTPHVSPETALVDQTRGLLREIAEAPSCSSQSFQDRGIDVTCVCSSGVSGNVFTTNVEGLVAASSYLPLLGKTGKDVKGDGIVPLELAFMEEPARRITVDKCEQTGVPVRHSHVLPTPYNLWDGYAPSIVLPEDFASYVSKGVLSQWAQYIR